jgi:antitoxin YefM
VAVSASEARSRLFPLIQQVNNDHVPVRISSKGGDAVLMSAEDFDSWQETIYLLRSPANPRRLIKLSPGIGQVSRRSSRLWRSWRLRQASSEKHPLRPGWLGRLPVTRSRWRAEGPGQVSASRRCRRRRSGSCFATQTAVAVLKPPPDQLLGTVIGKLPVAAGQSDRLPVPARRAHPQGRRASRIAPRRPARLGPPVVLTARSCSAHRSGNR